MEITEKERLMLVRKKGEIRRLTEEILENIPTNGENSIQIRKKVTGILSLISTIESYSNSKNYGVDRMREMANFIFSQLDLTCYVVADVALQIFCNTVNSIRFNFAHKGLKVHFPKISLNFGNITNK